MPFASMIELKRDRVIHELLNATGPGKIISPQLFQECLQKSQEVWPGRPDEFRTYCADKFAVSHATVDRWLEGKVAPAMSVRAYVIDHLRVHLTDANHKKA